MSAASVGGIPATFSWSVATPEGTVASGECEFLVVPTAAGELGILADHAAIAASVVPGRLRITTSGALDAAPRLVSVGAGVVDVRDNTVRVLVASAGGDAEAARTDDEADGGIARRPHP